MLRLLMISILLAAVKSEINVNEFLGEWVPVVTYPNRAHDKFCQSYNISLDDNLNCTCSDAVVPVLKFYNPIEKWSIVVPALFIDKPEEIEPTLSTECSCDGSYPRLVVLRKLSSNYFVFYANRQSGGHVTNVFLKTMPKLSELKAVIDSNPDLNGQEPAYFCEDSTFIKEYLYKC